MHAKGLTNSWRVTGNKKRLNTIYLQAYVDKVPLAVSENGYVNTNGSYWNTANIKRKFLPPKLNISEYVSTSSNDKELLDTTKHLYPARYGRTFVGLVHLKRKFLPLCALINRIQDKTG
jgi:hypothetical protein